MDAILLHPESGSSKNRETSREVVEGFSPPKLIKIVKGLIRSNLELYP